MAIFDSISSISNPTFSMSSSIARFDSFGSKGNNNSVACLDNGFNDGCAGRNTNIINIDINVGRRHRRRCC
ncbi:hypothetical protein RB653_010294 [Dictyostelium firmibasis]|uniref:Uncharacterized protein n=1 Tax=Dictyostelium firmibasis TaxID=79012 RepID=A0AAN7TLB7_9MYCE